MIDKFFELFHNEITEAKQQENHATTLHSICYWKGYREGIERALSILLKMKSKFNHNMIQDIPTEQDIEENELILIDGSIDISKNPITIDDFLDKFISWVEENHWYFGGVVR